MPFLAAMGPGMAALLGGGISAGGALGAAALGSRGAKSIAQMQQDQAQAMFKRSQPAYDQAYKFYSGLTAGGPQMQQSLGPSIGAINQQYDSALKNTVNSAYTRGGALDKALRNTQTGRAFSIADLYGKAPMAGAAGLTGLAGGDAANAAGLFANAQQGQYQNQQLQSQALSGIGSIFTRMLANPSLWAGNQPSAYQQGLTAYSGVQGNAPYIPSPVTGNSYVSYPSAGSLAGYNLPNTSFNQPSFKGLGF